MEKFWNDDVLTTEKGQVSYWEMKELETDGNFFEVCL